MSVYKKSVICTGIITVFSFAIAIILNYALNVEFWCNVCLGIFGSSLLSCITALIGYSTEKRNALESFSAETHKLLHEFNKYQRSMSLDDKINWYLTIIDYDKTTWDLYLGKIDFFDNRQRDYIYKKIYYPLLEVNNAIAQHMWNFRMHKSGQVRNEVAMESYVEEIEPYILETEGYTTRNGLVNNIIKELNGYYFEIMYGKKRTV